MEYEPPFKITAKAINLISEISAKLERFTIRLEQDDGIRLRKINRMKTIRGTLAIEGNTLSDEQITAVLEGKRIAASAREIQEVQNAVAVYDAFATLNPYKKEDLLKAHKLMMKSLVPHPGRLRKSDVCVAGKSGMSHIAPPFSRIPALIDDLFGWLAKSKDHALIKSSVFHYEFEFIHPFEDGNGRMGRLWQSRILTEWNPAFAHLPVENMIWKNQARYYKALERSTAKNDSGVFVDFMLGVILNAINERGRNRPNFDPVNDLENDLVNDPVNEVLAVVKDYPEATYAQIAKRIEMSEATVKRAFAKLKEQKRIRREGSAKKGSWRIIE